MTSVPEVLAAVLLTVVVLLPEVDEVAPVADVVEVAVLEPELPPQAGRVQISAQHAARSRILTGTPSSLND